MATLNIYSTEWLNVVFSARNKEYGAYVLRTDNPKNTTRALLAGSILFILSVLSPTIINYFTKSNGPDLFAGREVTLAPPPPLDTKVPPPAHLDPPKPRTDQIKFPPPVAVANPKTSDELPAIDQLKFADPGKETIDGSPDGTIIIDLPAGKGSTVEDKITNTGSDAIVSDVNVQVLPKFPGGAQAWAKFMQGYRYPNAAIENNAGGIVYVSFVVEKDGSLTDIKVLRDPGYGMAEEAIRLLKTSAKWSPGIQNGRPVRVQYTQPINLSIK